MNHGSLPQTRPTGSSLVSPVVWQLWFGFMTSSLAFSGIGYWLVLQKQASPRPIPGGELALWAVVPASLVIAELLARLIRISAGAVKDASGIVPFMVAFSVAELIAIAGVGVGIWFGDAQALAFFGGASILIFLRLAGAMR
jgi:hypothetical protein